MHHRVAGAFNLGHSLVLLGIRLARQPHINEQAVLAIDLRRPERLGFDRYQSFAALSLAPPPLQLQQVTPSPTPHSLQQQ